MTDREGASASGFPKDLRDRLPPSYWRLKARMFADQAKEHWDRGEYLEAHLSLGYAEEMKNCAETTTMRESGHD